MGLFLVVLPYPRGTDLAHLIEGVELIGVEHLVAERAVEPFQKRILIQLVQLNVPQDNTPVGEPNRKPVRKKLGPVIEPQGLGLIVPASVIRITCHTSVRLTMR